MSYLETLITKFYLKHDPSKLGDVSHVTGIVSWTKNNGMEALETKLMSKYKEGLTALASADDPPVESDWENVKRALERFYVKHEPTKVEAQVEEIYKWTIDKGVFALNERLLKKYGEALPKKALESWKSRWAPVVEENKSVNYEELLMAFFSIHDSNKPKSDIQFLANYAIKHGLDPVNEQLRANFGVGLEDVESQVTVVAGPSSMKAVQVKLAQPDPVQTTVRKQELVQQLTRFYQKYDTTKLTDQAAFDKIVDYGMNRGLKKLNQALKDKYHDDLDAIRRETIRQSVRAFAASQTQAGIDEEEEISFAMENGLKLLDHKLTVEYGANTSTGRTW